MTTDQRHPFSTSNRPRLGISACLLGEPVRYDGGHKRNWFLTEVLADFVDFIPVCPEAGSGMGIPRPPVQLTGQTGQERAVGVENPALDFTTRLQGYASQQKDRLADISGYIFKSRSPSCGLGSAKRTDLDGTVSDDGTGIFASTFLRNRPYLPSTEETSLDNTSGRDRFLSRVWIYWKWQLLFASGLDRISLNLFHDNTRPALETRCKPDLQSLDAIINGLNHNSPTSVADRYILALMSALGKTDIDEKIPQPCPYPESLESRIRESKALK